MTQASPRLLVTRKWNASFSSTMGLTLAFPALLLVLGFALVPVISIVGEVIATPHEFVAKMTDTVTVRAFWRTTVMSIVVMVAAIGSGLALAWCLVRVTSPV